MESDFSENELRILIYKGFRLFLIRVTFRGKLKRRYMDKRVTSYGV